MKTKLALITLICLTVIFAVACAAPAGQAVSTSNAAVTPTLLPVPPHPKHQTYDATLPPASSDKTKQITLHAQDIVGEVADGVPVDLWTFNGTVPAPVLHVNLGDTINFTLVNDTKMQHSIDFHAAQTAWNINYGPVDPGKSFSFTWTADYPGVFMYHCGTPPVIHHLANGMYGAIVVSSPDLKPVAKEYALVQSEFYVTQGTDGLYHTDGTKYNNVKPDYVVFNGFANQYKDAPLTANPGDRIRLWIVNAGPSTFSAFHVIGALFDTAYADGNPQNIQHGMQTVTVPPGGGYMVELQIPNAGLYPFVTHSFAYTGLGALGLIKIGDGGASQGGNTDTMNVQH